MHSFNDVSKLLSTINEEFGGTDFICCGMVKHKDIKDYIFGLKIRTTYLEKCENFCQYRTWDLLQNASNGFSALK